MQTKTAFILSLLAAGITSASAAQVSSWGELGPDGMDVRAFTTKPGAVDDVYTFSLGGASDVPSTINYYTATSLKGVQTINLVDATLSLYQGTYGDSVADTLVQSHSFGTTMTDYTYSGLTSGAYYFEVTGMATGTKGSDYYLDVAATAATPPLAAVPEADNACLMLSGLGALGLVMARRKRSV